MYRILVVEDDPSASDVLKVFVGRYAQEHDLELDVTVVPSAVEFAAERHPADLILMDIDLPGLNGLEAAELLRTYDTETPLVFVTNLAQYAVRGYGVDALDYLVKPVRYSDFSMVMDRAVRRMRRNAGSTVAVATRDGVWVVPTSEIVYVDVMNHDLSFHLENGTSPVARGPLANLERRLSSAGFVRISKSCLANMAHMRTVQSDSLCMTTGERLYISRSMKRAALATIADYLGGSI